MQWEKERAGGNKFEYGVCVKIGELLNLLFFFFVPFSMLLQFSRKFLERKMFKRKAISYQVLDLNNYTKILS